MSVAVSFIGLGSNLDEPEEQIARALGLLDGYPLTVERVSSLYRTEPVDAPVGPWFLNRVARVRSRLGPQELLRVCQAIERAQGRRRTLRHGPRTIDLDLLLVGDVRMDTRELTLPHPELHLRRFVLVPLVEIAPDLVHPRLGLNVKELLRRCPDASAVQRVGSLALR